MTEEPTSLPTVPENRIDLGDVMSNFDHEINPDAEDKLRQGQCFGGYSAWNFKGYVWFHDEQFHCEIWQHHSHTATLSANSLQELMDDASEQYGGD